MVLGVTWGWSLELQSKGFGEEPAHPRTIEPGNSTGISDEGDGAAHAKFLIQLPYLSREARQCIEDMRQAHEIPLHGIPVEGKRHARNGSPDAFRTVDIVDPGETLSAPSPAPLQGLWLKGLVKVDVAQQPKKGVGVWQGFDFRKQQPEVGD